MTQTFFNSDAFDQPVLICRPGAMVRCVPGRRWWDDLEESVVQVGALLGCVTLIFGLVGTINRMRFNADANVQKTLGMVADSYGATTEESTRMDARMDGGGQARA